ncbi:hypothetical protein MHYP_G00056280 [Metynnis hypsauchen]
MVNDLRSASVASVFIGDLHSQPSSQTVLPCAFFFTSLAALCAFIVACEGTGHTFKLTSLLGCLQAASCTAGQLPWSDDYLKKQFFQLKAVSHPRSPRPSAAEDTHTHHSLKL